MSVSMFSINSMFMGSIHGLHFGLEHRKVQSRDNRVCHNGQMVVMPGNDRFMTRVRICGFAVVYQVERADDQSLPSTPTQYVE